MISVERYGLEFSFNPDHLEEVRAELEAFEIHDRERWVELRESILSMYKDLDSLLKKYGEEEFQEVMLHNNLLTDKFMDALMMEYVLKEIDAFDA